MITVSGLPPIGFEGIALRFLPAFENSMENPQLRQKLFAQALATPPAERSAFLDSACGVDTPLRRDIDQMLADSAARSKSSGPGRTSPIPPTGRTLGRLKQALKNTYVIQERVGGGGMGELYLATHKTLGGKWAIKVLAEEYARNPKVVERFVNEAKIEANLQHPNIVKVFHIGHSGPFHYLVMSYVEGKDLAERIGSTGALPEPEGISIALQICKALECAHDNNITHRDLKPSNVRIDNYGTVVVIDFGIARARDVAMAGITDQGEKLGTPLYMSPEQAKGAQVDARADLYSLGVLMYEMFSGVNPFGADSLHGVYSKQLNYMPPPLVEVAPSVSAALSAIVMRLLEKEPGNRYQTARAVRKDLSQLYERTRMYVPDRTQVAPPVDEGETVNRLQHVVRRVTGTQMTRDLSPEETRVLELADGRRTVAQIIALTEMEPDRLFRTLDGLKGEKAVETMARPEPDSMVTFAPLKYRRYLLWGCIGLAVCVAGWLIYSRFVAVAPAALAVQFDASPFATVTIKSEKGREIQRSDTPFQYGLKPGKYTVEFSYQKLTRSREIVVESGKPLRVRETFWGKPEIDKLLNSLK